VRPPDDPFAAAEGWRGRLDRAKAAGGAVMAKAAEKAAGAKAALPEGVRNEIGNSVRRLSAIRSIDDAKSALTAEAERLFVAVTPLLTASPLPVSGWRARIAAGSAGGAAAAVEEAEAIAALVSWGGALPAAPVVAAALFSGWVLELWIAVSARVNQLHAAGREVDPNVLARELAGAIVGDANAVARDGAERVMRSVATHAVERWATGLLPGLGIALDSFDAQRTVAAILRRPVTAHPPKRPESPLAAAAR
jgi:hypothetical protein